MEFIRIIFTFVSLKYIHRYIFTVANQKKRKINKIVHLTIKARENSIDNTLLFGKSNGV